VNVTANIFICFMADALVTAKVIVKREVPTFAG